MYSYLRCLFFLSLSILARKEERSPKVLFAVSSSGGKSTKRVERRDKQDPAISLYCLEPNVPILEGRLCDSKVSLAARAPHPTVESALYLAKLGNALSLALSFLWFWNVLCRNSRVQQLNRLNPFRADETFLLPCPMFRQPSIFHNTFEFLI